MFWAFSLNKSQGVAHGSQNGDAVRVHDTGKFEDGGVFGT